MPRYTVAYSEFIQRLSEVKVLLQLANSSSLGLLTPNRLAKVNAICRGAVVLLSSHVEGYIEELGETVLQQVPQRRVPKTRMGSVFKYYLSQDLIDQIRRTDEPSRIASKIETLLSRDGYIWDGSTHYIQALPPDVFLAGFSNPNHERIEKFFNRFGYDCYSRDLGRELKANYPICKNMLNQVVEQRNRIAHGDSVTTSTPTDLKTMIDLVARYCRATDVVAGNWFRGLGCAIR